MFWKDCLDVQVNSFSLLILIHQFLKLMDNLTFGFVVVIFNEIAQNYEKKDRSIKMYSQMWSFHDMMNDCQFLDIGFNGPIFT